MMLLPCTLSVATLVALISILPTVLATCYYPNGAVSEDDYTQCPNRQSCCPKDAYCLSNGLCWTAANFLLRASCSDKSWTSTDCPKYCVNANPYSGKVMAPCNNNGLFSCDYDTCFKDNFTVSRGDVILRDYQQKSLGALVTVTASGTTSASTSITTTSSTSTSTASSLANENPNCVSSSSSPKSSSNQSSKLAAVGAGVGAPLAIALVAALALLGRERRKARRLELDNARLGGGGGGGPGMAGYRGPTAYQQQSAPKGNSNSAELSEESAVSEVNGQPMVHEMQTQRG